eukprot:2065600-Pleurochrysis_carterae.AAC.1
MVLDAVRLREPRRLRIVKRHSASREHREMRDLADELIVPAREAPQLELEVARAGAGKLRAQREKTARKKRTRELAGPSR